MSMVTEQSIVTHDVSAEGCSKHKNGTDHIARRWIGALHF